MNNVVAFPAPPVSMSVVRECYDLARTVLREIAAHPLTTVVAALDVLEHSTRRSDIALCRAARIEMAGLLADEVNRAARRASHAPKSKMPFRKIKSILGGFLIGFVVVGLTITAVHARSVIDGTLAQAAAVRAAQ